MSDAAATAGFARLLSDERLTRRAVGGDERAFAAIFRRYHQSLYRYCMAIVGNPEDAQDALQNTMVKVLRALPGEERKIELKPWLYRIAHNESIDLLRRRRETQELDVEQVTPGYTLAEDAETRERLRGLIADLRELPDRQREVLMMRELAGFDFEEIGTALDTTGAVIRQTLYEARHSLLQMEEGREMSCETVTRALSDGDGRVTRRRDVRAHLRSCADCRRFRDEIKSREDAFAALSPLPAVAAAGMLQGLLGGSQAAAGGGLAAALGGGAAQTIGASAAAKGVATIAVVAAVGVTAADRTGVIHLGLRGEGGAKSGPAVPGAGGNGSQAGSRAGGDGVAGGAAQGGGPKGKAGKPTQAPGNGTSKAVASPAQGGRASIPAEGHAPGAHPGNSQAGSKEHKEQGPLVEHPTGKGHEETPDVAAGGQETAAEHVPPNPGSGVGGNEKEPETDLPKSAPSSPPSAPPKQAPTSPPAAKPEPSQGQAPSQPAPKSEAAAPPVPSNPGKGSEKSGEAGKKE